jgi:hypothetical protein
MARQPADPGLDLAGADGGEPAVAEVRVDVAAQVGLDVSARRRSVDLCLAPALGVLAHRGRVVGIDVVEDVPEAREATAAEIVRQLEAFRTAAPWPLPDA